MGEKNGNNRGKGNPNGFGGKYVRKAQNLSAAQLKKAGAAKAAKKRTVDISQTSRAYGKGVTLGPGGKPLTGTVNMGNGNTAVYKNGKRVVKAAAPKAKPAASRSRSAAPATRPTTKPATKPTTKPNPKPDTKNKNTDKGAAKPAVKFGKTYTTTTQTNPQASSKPASASKSVTPSHLTGYSLNKPGGGSPPKGKPGQVLVNGRWVAGNSSTAKAASGPKEGDKKTFMTGPATFKNGKWVKDK